MAQGFEVSCTQCDVEPAVVIQGGTMRPSLFESAAGYCRHCDLLVDCQVPAPINDLAVMAEDLPKDASELLALAVRLRQKPRCPQCDRQVLRLKLWETDEEAAAQGEDVRRPKCRRCGEQALKAQVCMDLD